MSENTWIQEAGDGSLRICVHTSIYPLEAIFRACYIFTDRCYLFLEPDATGSIINVWFSQKTPDCNLAALAGEFSNELLDQRVRLDIAAETRTVRELIVAQAFAEADLLGDSKAETDYLDDPRGIAR